MSKTHRYNVCSYLEDIRQAARSEERTIWDRSVRLKPPKVVSALWDCPTIEGRRPAPCAREYVRRLQALGRVE